MTSYVYSLTVNFAGGLNSTQLHTEITSNVGITKTLVSIAVDGDVVTIIFATPLTGGETTILNGIIAAHVPATLSAPIALNVTIPDMRVKTTTYKSVTSFPFLGGALNTIHIIGMMEQGGTSYTVRIYDISKRQVIATATFSNITEQINSLGTISNVPTTTSIFDVQVRVTGTTTAIIKNLYYT